MRDRMRQQAVAAPEEEEREALRTKERELTNRIERYVCDPSVIGASHLRVPTLRTTNTTQTHPDN